MASVVYGKEIVKAGVIKGVDWCIAKDGQNGIKGFVHIPEDFLSRWETMNLWDRHEDTSKNTVNGENGSYWVVIDGISQKDIQNNSEGYASLIAILANVTKEGNDD